MTGMTYLCDTGAMLFAKEMTTEAPRGGTWAMKTWSR